MTRLQAATGLAYSTIHRAFRGFALTYRTAGRLSAATGGHVTIPELCDPGVPVDLGTDGGTAPGPDATAETDGRAAAPGGGESAATGNVADLERRIPRRTWRPSDGNTPEKVES